MKVLIDADACPVVDIAIKLCVQYGVDCTLFCDTAHQMQRDGATTLVFDKGADSVDFALVNRVNPGDIVVTQDYGLASMCLAKQARILHQDGWEYTQYNIDALLFQRHTAKEYRAAAEQKVPLKERLHKIRILPLLLKPCFNKCPKGKYPAGHDRIPSSRRSSDDGMPVCRTIEQSHSCLRLGYISDLQPKAGCGRKTARGFGVFCP